MAQDEDRTKRERMLPKHHFLCRLLLFLRYQCNQRLEWSPFCWLVAVDAFFLFIFFSDVCSFHHINLQPRSYSCLSEESFYLSTAITYLKLMLQLSDLHDVLFSNLFWPFLKFDNYMYHDNNNVSHLYSAFPQKQSRAQCALYKNTPV